MKITFFAPDPAYREMIKSYNKTDALLAFGAHLCLILLYLGAGYLRMAAGFTMAPIFANIITAGIVLLFLRIRKQKLRTVGFTLNRFKRALAIGAVAGVIVEVCANVIPALFSEDSSRQDCMAASNPR